MELEDLFYYDETSYSCLRRNTDWRSGKNGCTLRASKGDTTGSLTDCGYYVVYCGKLVFAHIVVWKIHNGPIPKGFHIDHIDGDRKNNKLSNLRIVTTQHNSHNAEMKCCNTSGYNGIHERGENGHYRFIVQCNNLDGSRHSKSFSINKYGREQALNLAIEYREEYIKKLNTQGACYTERHGKPKEEVNG